MIVQRGIGRIGKSPWRLKALIAAHLFVSAVLASRCLVPAHAHFLPILWTLASFSLAQLVLLSFWTGLGFQRAALRFFGAVFGSMYLAAWPALGARFAPHPVWASSTDWGNEFVTTVGTNCAVVLFLAALFYAARRWFIELKCVDTAPQTARPEHYQYSLFHLLVATSVAAVVLALVRIAKRDGPGAPTDWQLLASQVLMIVAIVLNAICAVWSSLAVGPVGLRAGLVLLVSVLLGVAVAEDGRAGSPIWWLFPSFALILALPTAIVIASLLVVRSCGYRLIARTKAAG